MSKDMPDVRSLSRLCWENFETVLRQWIQELIQAALEDEVGRFLGRAKYERRDGTDAPRGYRNGFGKERNLTLCSGTITLRRPRVRDVDDPFESRLLPLFCSRTKEVDNLIPQLYLHGLAEGDFDLALRGLLGENAPISASTVARLKEVWQGQFEAWSKQPLDPVEVVYLWVDGLYVKAGLEKEKSAVLVALAGLSDGSKKVLALRSGYRESKESWAELLRDLKDRGMNCPRLVIGDGHLGIWGALAEIYPGADEQRCWNHKLVNVLDKLPKKAQGQGKALLRRVMYAPSREEAEQGRESFHQWCRERGYRSAGEVLDRDWERMLAFYRFPKEHWGHLRTTNPIESPFSMVRLRTDAAKRYQKVERATAVIWKVLMVAEGQFRRLNAPHLLEAVLEGQEFINGVRHKRPRKEETEQILLHTY